MRIFPSAIDIIHFLKLWEKKFLKVVAHAPGMKMIEQNLIAKGDRSKNIVWQNANPKRKWWNFTLIDNWLGKWHTSGPYSEWLGLLIGKVTVVETELEKTQVLWKGERKKIEPRASTRVFSLCSCAITRSVGYRQWMASRIRSTACSFIWKRSHLMDLRGLFLF